MVYKTTTKAKLVKQKLYRVNLNLQHDEAVVVMAASETEANAKVKKIFSPYLDEYGFHMTEEVDFVKFKEEKPEPRFSYYRTFDRDCGSGCAGGCSESSKERRNGIRVGGSMRY